MPRTSAVHAVTTIGIDMGKNTLHMIGLDTRGERRDRALGVRFPKAKLNTLSTAAELQCSPFAQMSSASLMRHPRRGASS